MIVYHIELYEGEWAIVSESQNVIMYGFKDWLDALLLASRMADAIMEAK